MSNRESQARGSRALSIDRIGLDQPANGAGEFAHLARIDYRRRQPGFGQSSSNDTLITAASFQNDKARSPQSPHQLGQAIGIDRAKNAAPAGRTSTSTRAFEISMPTKQSALVSTSITRPPRCRLVPRRLFGFMECRPAPHAP